MLSYIGPGGALSAIGSFLALLAAVLLALFGFVWYPIKRMLRARKTKQVDATVASQGNPQHDKPLASNASESRASEPGIASKTGSRV